MANPFFGDIGDVWKHLVMSEVILEERPRAYWESHAGSARYRITETSEREHGVLYFVRQVDSSSALGKTVYVRLLSSLNDQEPELTLYPGSPLVAMLTLGKSASQYFFCDVDEQSIRDVGLVTKEQDLSGRTEVVLGDGVEAVFAKSHAQSVVASDTFVLVDPFEPHTLSPERDLSAFDLVCNLATRGFKTMFWYAYERRVDRGWPLGRGLREVDSERIWIGDLEFDRRDSGMSGCGVALLNLSDQAIRVATTLGAELARIYSGANAPGVPNLALRTKLIEKPS